MSAQPRIPPRPAADFDDAVRDALSVLRLPRTARPAPQQQPAQRRVPNMVGIFAWHPALTKAFLTFNNHLFSSTLPDRAREMVTVRVAWLRRGEYEWSQHVTMARAAGMSPQEISAISDGPGSPAWGPLDAALLRSADEIIADRRISDQTWEALAGHFDRQELMDLVFTIGAYDLLAMAFNTFGLELDPGMAGFPPSTELD
jgi:alkylhydroperoxidase family enzyme